MIDIHTHIGPLSFAPDWPTLTAEMLIERMDENGIEKSVILTLDSPEAVDGCLTVPEALKAVEAYPDRLIAFAAVDPRRNKVAEKIHLYREVGCGGFG